MPLAHIDAPRPLDLLQRHKTIAISMSMTDLVRDGHVRDLAPPAAPPLHPPAPSLAQSIHCFPTAADRLGPPRSRAKFTDEAREKVLSVRRQGACLRCRILKIQVCPLICHSQYEHPHKQAPGQLTRHHYESVLLKTRASPVCSRPSRAPRGRSCPFATACALASPTSTFLHRPRVTNQPKTCRPRR